MNYFTNIRRSLVVAAASLGLLITPTIAAAKGPVPGPVVTTPDAAARPASLKTPAAPPPFTAADIAPIGGQALIAAVELQAKQAAFAKRQAALEAERDRLGVARIEQLHRSARLAEEERQAEAIRRAQEQEKARRAAEAAARAAAAKAECEERNAQLRGAAVIFPFLLAFVEDC